MSTPPSSRALVTGASRGIGAAIVRMLAARNCEVHAVALDEPDLAELAASTGAITHPLDLRDRAATEAALGELEIDIAVNNAGVLPALQPFQEQSGDLIDLTIDVNLRAALQVTRLVLPGMLARGSGHLIYIGSIAGRHPTPYSAVYAATKAALHAFAEGLRCDLLGTDIRVTVMMPGRVETSLYDGALGSRDAAHERLYADFDAVQPDDVAAAIAAALDMPLNVDLTAIEILPTRQIFGGSTIAKRADSDQLECASEASKRMRPRR
jgi:3-hydroxy acid dehydrogenase / malonic semialdehyde reductase